MRTTSNTLKLARRLRRKMSLPEVLLWRHLRSRERGKPIFRRQHPIGPFVLDFFCTNARLCIEVDGGAHALGERQRQDLRRDIFLIDQGIRTVRIAAGAVLRNPEGAARYVLDLARGPSAPSTASRSPSPARLAGEV